MFPSPVRVPIIMPQLGESIAEATIVSLAVRVGDRVEADQEIIEVETNKALMQVTTPCAGTVLELSATAQETYAVGATLGFVEASPEEAARLGIMPQDDGISTALPDDVEPGTAGGANGNGLHDVAAVVTRAEVPSNPAAGDRDPASARPSVPATTPGGGAGGLPVPAKLSGAGYLSPRVRARVAELGLGAADLAGVTGSGANGRVTTEDLEKFLTDLETNQTAKPAAAMRVAVGDAMRRSWSRPLATVGRPVVLDALLAHRKTQPEPKPGIVLYAIRALALAIAENPAAASRLIGKKLVTAASVDIGFAVEVDDGLMVPVLRAADQKSLSELNSEYQDLVAAARRRQLPPGTSGNAVASVTNFGTFGLTWATPIPLPEETLMLGLGSGRKVPVWDEEKGDFIPAVEAEVTLTIDHRALDGGGAGRLLAHVARLMAEPEKL